MRSILVSILLLVMIGCPRAYGAEGSGFKFDSQLSYDIFFYTGESHTSVVENATIDGFQEIAGKKFLVIRSKGFKLSEEVGYVLFDSVIAILPDRTFRVKETDRVFRP